MYLLQQNKGFQTLELLIVIGIVITVASFAIPSLHRFQTSAQIDTVALEIVHGLRRAQVKARANLNDSAWGVYFDNQKYIIFKGNNYAVHDSGFDEEYDISASIDVINDLSDQIIFNAVTGLPDKSGSITLSNASNETVTITINSIGISQY